MSDQSRAFPGRPNLRYLKLEAKRRLAAGEFGTLHDAQLAIAREHDLPSWTALKEFVSAQAGQPGPALSQVRWVLARFAGAGGPAWAAPGEEELRAHFSGHFLTVVRPAELTGTLTQVATQLGGELSISRETPLSVRGQLDGLAVEAAAEADPPHRLTTLRMYPLSARVRDPRTAAPGHRTSGAVPAAAAAVAGESFAEFGLPGLVLAGADPAGEWSVAWGWADLDRDETLHFGHRFPAYSITKLITATAILRLAADGRISLDDPANRHLRTVRLADGTVTVRELLSHTGGVASPDELFGSRVPGLAELTGPVLACPGPRGTFRYSNGGYAALGQLISDIAERPYPEAATSLVLEPLGMTSSAFPERWPGRGAITGYRLAEDGTFEPVPAQACTIPAAGGLWSTAADLVRFGHGWTGLLPSALAREALRPHADRDPAGAQIGLGWLLHRPKDLCGHAGGGPGAASSLLSRLSDGQTSVVMANRLVPIEPVNARLARPVD
jgi:CubicO group peptidase (beta-lactamase class C family)